MDQYFEEYEFTPKQALAIVFMYLAKKPKPSVETGLDSDCLG